MRLTRQAALAIALVCGLLAAVGAWLWIGQQNKPVPKAPETVEVPVPIQTIPAQTDLLPEMFKKVTLPKAQVAANVVVNEPDLIGRINRTELLMDKPVTADQIAVRSNALGLAYTINRGQRAMSIALDMVAAVCDFVQAGDRVDVVANFGREGKVVVRTLVQDVLVLAAGTATNPRTPAPAVAAVPGAATPPPADQSPPKRPDMPFTLAVTPEQAQIIIAADVAGKLRLLLRRMGDHSIVPLPNANSWTLIGPVPDDRKGGPESSGPANPEATPPSAPSARTAESATVRYGAAPTAPPPVVPAKPSVEIIRGSQREIVTPQ